MKVSILGGGSFGTTLAQVLEDNKHEVYIYDINEENVFNINQYHRHPFFKDIILSNTIKATSKLEEIANFSQCFIICIPTKAIRSTLRALNPLLKEKSLFINVSKGIEPVTLNRISEIVEQEISSQFRKGYVMLTGPCHAEEIILRKITALVSVSKDQQCAKEVQLLFYNEKYLRVYTSDDLVSAEVGGAIKNVISVVSGILTGFGSGENARAALISRGILEIMAIAVALGGKKETVFGLTGIGDLIVTASSENSRNFQAGKKIGQGMKLNEVLGTSKMVVEGLQTILAAKEISDKYQLDLPIIHAAYQVIYENYNIYDAINDILTRELKSELEK